MHYPNEYPDALPDLSIEATEGELSDHETEELLNGLKAVVRYSLQSILSILPDEHAGRRESRNGYDFRACDPFTRKVA